MSVRERHRREREARATAILMAAARVFARHGLEGATIEMVAREAEVAVGTIYLYFASRDDLYLSLVALRGEQLRERYIEIQSRNLTPLDELYAIAGAYLDYLRESRELFISQQSVSYAKLEKRLKRAGEIRHFRRVMDLSHEVFGLWEKTVKRACDGGLIINPMGAARTAAVMWANLNGAFLLMGDDNFFRGVTGLNPEHFIEEALESHLAAGALAAREHNGNSGANAIVAPKVKVIGAARNGRTKVIKERGSDEVPATASA